MKGLISQFVRDFGSRDAEARADLRMLSQLPGVVSVKDLRAREMSRVAGVVSSLTRSCSSDSPQFDITVADGTGEVHAQFLGRRDISGIKPGTLVVLSGRFCEHDGRMRAHNPVYELVQTRDDRD